MSRQIDERVVEMKFDNKEFERNAKESMSTLDRLKKSLNLEGAAKGFDEIDKASKKVDVTKLGSALDTVKTKFSALETIAVGSLLRIGQQAVDAGEKLIKSLTIEPISQGFDEYELKMGSVQTIMASTGAALDEVNQYLEELNHYADKTIYSFSDMTQNIGKFTNAGVKLEDAVKAIQGVSNEAAISGANANEASRAMYNFAQALSAGYVKLIDWKSIENANMATVAFKQNLIDTALAMGTIVEESGAYRTVTTDNRGAVSDLFDATMNFNDALSHQWLTTDVLVQSLSNYATDVREMTEAEKKAYEEKLRGVGYTEEQIASIEQLGSKAFDAAQDVKTFTQLIDTLKEAVGSGWAQTFEIIFGDFNEAKELWTEFSQVIGGFIDQQSTARNELLRGGLGSGWKQFLAIDELKNTMIQGDYSEWIMDIATDHGIAVYDMIEETGSLEAAMKKGWVTADLLGEGIDKLTKRYKEYSSEELAARGVTAQEVHQLEILNKMIKRGAISLDEYVDKINQPTGRDNLIQSLRNSCEALLAIIHPIGEAFDNIFPDITADKIYNMTVAIRDFTASLKISGETGDKIRRTFEGIFSVFDIFGQAIGAIFRGVGSLVGEFVPLGEGVLSITSGFGDWVTQLDNGIRDTKFFDNIVSNIVSRIKAGIQAIKDFFSPFRESVDMSAMDALTKMLEGIGNIVNKVRENVASAIESLKGSDILGVLGKLGELLGKIGESVLSFVGSGISKTLNQISNADFSGILDFLSTLSVGGLAVAIRKIFKTIDSGLKFSGFDGIKNSVIDTLDKIKGTLSAFQDELKSDALMRIAKAIAILAGSLFVLSIIDSDKLDDAVGGMTMMFAELVGSMAVLSKIDVRGEGIRTAVNSMIKIAAAMLIAAFALKKLGDMNMDQIGRGLLAFSGLAAIMTACIIALEAASKRFKARKIKGLFSFAASMILLTVALKEVANLNTDQIIKGLSGIGGIAAIMTATIIALQFASSKFKKGGTKGLLSFALAINLLMISFNSIANLNTDQIIKGLSGIGGIAAIMTATIIALQFASSKFKKGGTKGLLSFALAINLLMISFNSIANLNTDQIIKGLSGIGGIAAIMTVALGSLVAITGKFDNGSILKVAASMLVMSSAILVLTPSLMLLGSMNFSSIVKALGAIAGAFTVLGIAGLLLKPIVPSIIGLSAAIFLVGAGALAAGVGLLAFAAGIAALVGALAHGSVDIVQAIENIVTGIVEMIPNVASSIAEGAPIIGEAVKAIVLSLVDVIVECAPKIVDGAVRMITEVLSSLVTYGPAIVDLLLQLIIQLIEGVANRMPELIQAGVDLIMPFFTGVIDALKGIDTEELIRDIAGIGFISAIMLALSAVSSLIPSAMIGVLGVGGVIAELAIVLAAIGALAQIPGLNWLIGEGGKLLENVGSAIGGFIGSIVSGVMVGVTSRLPEVADYLSSFATKLQPFIRDIKNLDNDVLKSVGILAGVIIAIGAAEVLGAISSLLAFVTGGNSLATLGSGLAAFTPYFIQFANDTAGINGIKVQMAAIALGELFKALAAVPNEGGLIEFIVGKNNLEGYGEKIEELGDALYKFYDKTKDVKRPVIETSAASLVTLFKAFKEVPNDGGIAGFIFGNNDIEGYGDKMVAIGDGLYDYWDKVKDIDEAGHTAISNSASSLVTLFNAFKEVPNDGGIIGFILGNNDIGGYGAKMSSLGWGLYNYYNHVKDIESFASVNTSAWSLRTLFNAFSQIPTDGGIVGRIFGGGTDLETIGTALGNIGSGLATYYGHITDIEYEKLDESVQAIRDLFTLAADVDSLENVYSLEEFLSSFQYIGEDCVTNFSQAFLDSQETISETIQQFLQMVGGVIEENYPVFYEQGIMTSTNWQNGIIGTFEVVYQTGLALANQVLNALTFTLPSFYAKGVASGVQYLNGIRVKYPEAYSVGQQLGANALSGVQEIIPQFVSAGEQAGQGFVDGLNSMIGQAMSIASSFAASIPTTMAGVLDMHSPSRVTENQGELTGEGFIIGLAKMINKATNVAATMGEKVVESSKSSIGAMSAIFADSFDVNPTITPLVDLTNVETSAQRAVRLFNESLGNVSVRASGIYTGIDGVVDARARQNFQNDGVSPTTTGGNVYNFNQTNNSPKELSRIEIYRDTKNQFTAFKRYIEKSNTK